MKKYLILTLIVSVLAVSYIAEKEKEEKQEPDFFDLAQCAINIVYEMTTPEFREAWDAATKREEAAAQEHNAREQ